MRTCSRIYEGALVLFALCLPPIWASSAGDAVANTYPPLIQGSGAFLAIDTSGNRYVTGSLVGTFDFNPGFGADVKTGAGTNNVFVTRFNADGSYSWTQTFGGSGRDEPTAIAISPNGSTVYVTGNMGSKNAQVGGAGPAVGADGAFAAFVLALNAADGTAKTNFGLFNCGVQKFGGTSAQSAFYQERGEYVFATDSVVYVSGEFYSSDSKIGGAGTAVANSASANLGSNAFLIALDASGNAASGFGNAGILKYGGSLGEYGNALLLSGTTLYWSGYFASTDAQLNGTTYAGSGTDSDGYVFALNASTAAPIGTFGSRGQQIMGGRTAFASPAAPQDYAGPLAILDTTLYVGVSSNCSDFKIGGAGTPVSVKNNGNEIIVALDVVKGTAKMGFGIAGMQVVTVAQIPNGALSATNTGLFGASSFSGNSQIGSAASLSSTGGVDACVFALDLATGCAKTNFGLSSSGMQKFGGSGDESCSGLAMYGSTLYFSGHNGSLDAGLGGVGDYSNTTFGNFLVPLDVSTGLWPKPIITSATVGNATFDSFYMYTLAATDTPLSGLSATNLPGGLAFTNGVISGLPAVSGTYNLNLTAANPGGTTNGTLILSILKPTATAVSPASVTYNVSSQNISLGALVTSTAGPVSEGTVTFQLKNGSTNIGLPATTPQLSNGSAGVTYSLPPGTAAGTYTVAASYSGSINFRTSADSAPLLTVNPAATTTSSANVAATFTPSAQSISLAATVSSASGTVSEGTVTFQLKNGPNNVGSPLTSGTVVNGQASVSYPLPPSMGAGAYTIAATFNTSSDFISSSDNSKILTIAKGAATVTVANSRVTYDGQPKTVSVTVQPPSLTLNVAYGGSTAAPSISGVYPVDAVVADANYSGSASGQLIIDKAAASVVLDDLIQSFDGNPKHVAVSTIPANLNVVVNYNGGTTAPADPGSYAVSAIVSDVNYGGSAGGILTVTAAPVIVSPLNVSAVVQQPFSYSIVAAGVSPISFTAAQLPKWMSLTGSTLSGTPDATGILQITLTAGNSSGMDSQTLSVTVNPAGAPLITSPLSAAGPLNVLFTYNIRASGDAPLTYKAAPLPPGLSLTNGTISGTPTIAGKTAVKLTVTNAKGSDSEGLTITITGGGAPHLTSPLTIFGRVGAALDYPITATGQTPLTFSTKQLPAGLVLDPQSGHIKGTPLNDGNFPVVLIASNAIGTDIQVVTFSIRSMSQLSPQVVDIDISRNPARIDTDVAFAVKAVSTPGTGLTFYWYFFDSALVQDGPVLQGATVQRSFQREDAYYCVVRVFDGLEYGQDSAKFNIGALEPNASGAGPNIADNQLDNNSSSTRINIGSSLAGVIDFDIAPAGKNSTDLFSQILGRTAGLYQDNHTAFKFTQSEIVIVQALDIDGTTPLAQRMVAVSDQEIETPGSIAPPADQSLHITKFNGSFNFAARNRQDMLSMTIQLKLAGGLDLQQGIKVYFGIGNVIVALISQGKLKPMQLTLSSSAVPDVQIKSYVLRTTAIKTGVTPQDLPATITLFMVSRDLVKNALRFTGIADVPTEKRAIPLEALMIVGGCVYRQTFTATYANKKHKGSLLMK